MSLFAISDLHLSFGTDKPMDVFGERWEGYEKKLEENWIRSVGDSDTVILCGDNSWATYLADAHFDFGFINRLPGKKILSKGNHDYWWTTLRKMQDFCAENNFNTINFLHNNYYMYGNAAICGTRGWADLSGGDGEKKIYERELERLRLSIKSALRSNPDKIIAALHYPPDKNFRKILKEYGVKKCVYGHLHGYAQKNVINDTIDGIKYILVSCDFLHFNPLKLF